MSKLKELSFFTTNLGSTVKISSQFIWSNMAQNSLILFQFYFFQLLTESV